MNLLRFVCKLTLLILSLLFLINSATLFGMNDDYVSIEKLTKELNTRNVDRIIKTLNMVKRMSYQGKILPFIRDLWEERKDKYPNLPWNIVNEEVIKVELANILLQAAANGKIEIDTEKLHKYVLGLIDSEDTDVARSAILTLSIIDDVRDVDKIFAIAKQQKKGTFRASVLTLANMCNSAANIALEQLENYVDNSELKFFITNTRNTMEDFKIRTHWCDRKLNP